MNIARCLLLLLSVIAIVVNGSGPNENDLKDDNQSSNPSFVDAIKKLGTALFGHYFPGSGGVDWGSHSGELPPEARYSPKLQGFVSKSDPEYDPSFPFKRTSSDSLGDPRYSNYVLDFIFESFIKQIEENPDVPFEDIQYIPVDEYTTSERVGLLDRMQSYIPRVKRAARISRVPATDQHELMKKIMSRFNYLVDGDNYHMPKTPMEILILVSKIVAGSVGVLLLLFGPDRWCCKKTQAVPNIV